MNNYRVPDMAQKYMNYDMIRTHTELPEFANIRTKLLYTFLNNGTTTSDHKELYALATSLVQLGLDTHDLVSDQHMVKQKVSRSNQLKVLAGDYFSGRFYQLLAYAGHIDIIKMISQAVCEVNKIKLNLYERVKQLKLTADEYIQQSIEIKTTLFQTFSKHMEGNMKNKWHEILKGFTHCEILSDELSKVDSKKEIKGSWAFWYILNHATGEEKAMLLENDADSKGVQALLHKYKAYDHLYHMLDSQFQQLNGIIASYEGTLLKDELFEMIKPYAHQLTSSKMLKPI